MYSCASKTTPTLRHSAHGTQSRQSRHLRSSRFTQSMQHLANSTRKTLGLKTRAQGREQLSVFAQIALLYSSSTGSTASVAEEIKECLGDLVTEPTQPDDVEDIASFLSGMDGFLFGAPTWNTTAETGRSGLGMDAVCAALRAGELTDAVKGKKAAVYGCGDALMYGDNFSEMVDEMYHALKGAGADMVGLWEYTMDDSDDSNPRFYEGFTESKSIVGSGGASDDGQSQGSAEDGSTMYGLICDHENHSEMTPARAQMWCEQLKSEMGL